MPRLLLLALALLAMGATYPPSSALVDFSFVRDAPTPGFLRVAGGVFTWEDGARARFWGVNVANRNLWLPHDEIDRMVEAVARSGANMVRFEALDSRGGLLDVPGRPGTRALHPERLDTLHYWIHRLRQRRIHYYLDLIDFREFSAEDGVENAEHLGRAARPYAVFDPRLIELQKEYATQLLTARNPYTGDRPVDDPFLALLEICNESGFFLYPRVTVEPYRSRLLQRFGGEELPRPDSPEGARFYHEVQRDYFRQIRDHLRGLGLRIPVTAVMSGHVPADLASVAAELDFVAGNWYWDHPAFARTNWEGAPSHHDRSPLRTRGENGFAPTAGRLRWDDKPVVIREWGIVWPNRHRAVSIPEVAAYAGLQDLDAVLLFGYKAGDRLVQFGYQQDPTVWNLFGAGGLAFLRGDVAPAAHEVVLRHELGSAPAPAREAYRHRLRSTLDPGPASPTPAADAALPLATDTGQALLRVVTPRTCALAGEFLPGAAMRAGPLTVRTRTPRGAVMATSLDGLPLETSRRVLIALVSTAENDGQVLTPEGGRLVLTQEGTAPVTTRERPGPETVVELAGRTVARVPTVNGSWERVLDLP